MRDQHNIKQQLLTDIVKVWQELNLPAWDKYDWAMYTSMTNEELRGALNSLKLENSK